MDFDTPEKRRLHELVRSAWSVDSGFPNPIIKLYGHEWGSIGDFCTDNYSIIGPLIEESQDRRERLERMIEAVEAIKNCPKCRGVGATWSTGTTEYTGSSYAEAHTCSCVKLLMELAQPEPVSVELSGRAAWT